VRRLRDALRRDDFGVACDFCDWQVRSGHRSIHAKIYDELQAGAGDELWPSRMDFTLSNTCNLACVMKGRRAPSRSSARGASRSPARSSSTISLASSGIASGTERPSSASSRNVRRTNSS